MIQRLRRRRYRSGAPIAALGLLAAVLAAWPRPSFGQACCAGGSVVTPTRLSLHEDFAAGFQLRARTNPGAFDSSGRYSSSGGQEQILEQDIAATARVAEKGQLGFVLPLIQTHRQAGSIDDWGSGVGDLSLTGRYDFLLAAESLRWPGIGALGALTLPTGTPPDSARHPLAADATGEGTYELTVGLSLEKIVGSFYLALNGWLTHRFSRSVPMAGAAPVKEDFALRWTVTAIGSYVFSNEAALGLYISALDEGAASIDGARYPGTALRLTTVGAAALLPIRDLWRLQGTVFFDLPLSSFGRNEVAGIGLTAAVVRVWL